MSGALREISTRNLSVLPTIDTLKRISQAIATLDAILSPEWESRYYSFNSKWSVGEAMGSMRNGSGDDFFIHFSDAGAVIKGYDHESVMARFNVEHGQPWPGVLDKVPSELMSFLAKPAFSIEETTFCTWRRWTDGRWMIGDIAFPRFDLDPDGSAGLLFILDGNPATYKTWAVEYYSDVIDDTLPLASVERLYNHEPLTSQLVRQINPSIRLADIIEDLEEIGYPYVTE